MKQIKIITLLLGVTFSVCGQSSPSIRLYNAYINQAELAICDGDLAAADSIYSLAFRIKKPLAQELRTAYWVAMEMPNNEKILQIAKTQLELGNGWIAEGYKEFSHHFDSVVYNQLLVLEANTSKTYRVEFDTILKNLIDRDQQYRMQGMGRSPQQFALDEENRALIRQFYREYPDFNEYVAGYYYMSTLGVVLLHAVQTGHYDLQPLIRDKVMSGIFPAASYMEFEAEWAKKKHQYGSDNVYYIGNTLFVEQPENLKQINKNRAKLGLAETWQDAIKKRVWECEHNSYFITGNRSIIHFGDDEDDAMESARRKKEIDAEHAKRDFRRMYYEK